MNQRQLLNQRQTEFIRRAMQQLTEVIDQCCQRSTTASATLGRKRVGRHIVIVRVIAEFDNGFSAPLGSHASKLGAEPDYSIKTEHHNKSRTSRWHKPFF